MSKSKPRKICGYDGCKRPVGKDAYGSNLVRCTPHKGKHLMRNGRARRPKKQARK